MRGANGIFLGLAYAALVMIVILGSEPVGWINPGFMPGALGAALAAVAFGHVGVFRGIRMKRMYRDLKGRYPVVYGCGLHASLRTRCVTSDREFITVWDYDRKGEYEVDQSLKRAATVLRREKVQASQAMKYEGLVIGNSWSGGSDYMIIYRGYAGSALFPLRGEALERARKQLSQGIADAD